MSAQRVPLSVSGPSGRQWSVRRRAGRLSFKGAVRLAADMFFRFTHRASRSKALWSETERVWLGNKTFLNWALRDAHIDIPWVVALAADAPQTTDELDNAVRAELVAYWADRLASLPQRSAPGWLPLP
jgi:hypothetical protein